MMNLRLTSNTLDALNSLENRDCGEAATLTHKFIMHKIDGMTSIGVIITQKCKLDTNQLINNGIVNISSNKPTDETGYGI